MYIFEYPTPTIVWVNPFYRPRREFSLVHTSAFPSDYWANYSDETSRKFEVIKNETKSIDS
jgi:hypothetical protein